MPAKIYLQNVYSLDKPMWHNLGTVGKKKESAEKVYGRMSQVSYSHQPFIISLNGKEVESGNYGIVMTDANGVQHLIGRSKTNYNITQPETYCKMFDVAVGAPVETLGFLDEDASRMFLTWDLPAISVYGDKVQNYGFLAAGFDGNFGANLFLTSVRVVCANTWAMAISSAGDKKGKGKLYGSKHSHINHERDLKIWMEYIHRQATDSVKLYEGLFRKMESIRVTKTVAGNLFAKVYPFKDEIGSYYPEALRGEREALNSEHDNKQQERRDLAMSLFEGAGVQITPTVWGAYNCITEMQNYHIPSKKDTTNSILVGNRQELMAGAFKAFSEYALAKGK